MSRSSFVAGAAIAGAVVGLPALFVAGASAQADSVCGYTPERAGTAACDLYAIATELLLLGVALACIGGGLIATAGKLRGRQALGGVLLLVPFWVIAATLWVVHW